MTLNVYFETNIAFVQDITLRAAITCEALEDHVLTYLKSTEGFKVLVYPLNMPNPWLNGLILMEFISYRKRN
jgi:hypothetical protein